MTKGWGWVLAALVLAGCSAQKIPITGTRIPVVNYESSVKVDEEMKNTIVALPLSEIGRDWPQCGGGAEHAMPHLSLNDTLEPQWTVSIGSGNGSGRFLSSPIVNEGEIYALDTYGMVTAVHAPTGESFWSTNIAPEGRSEPIIGGGLAYGAGKIFVTSPHAEVLALDAKTGEILWRHPTQSPVRAAPTFSEGRVYVLAISNHLQVLDAEKGESLWDHAGITEYAGLLGTASPAVSKGVVIVTYSSGEIFALKSENGHQLWTETLSSTRRPDSLSALSHIRALPVVDENKVIVIGHNQKMAAYDLRKGERLWERSIGGTRTPAVVGGYIFMINSHNELLCLTRDYGQVVWVRKLDSDPDHPYKVIWEGPLVAGNKLYLVSTSGTLVALDPSSGKTFSERQLGAPLSLAPFVAQETLYILTDHGDLMTFR
jgi:outer membrane protein assembly factor BamB